MINRVVVFQARDVGGAVTNTYYYSDKSFTTLPSDTPSNTFIEGRIREDAIVFISKCFEGSSLYGKGSSSVGAIRLVNNDGGLDFLRSLAYRGRTVEVWQGNGAYPSGYTKTLSGKIERINTSMNDVEILFKDRSQDLDKPMSANVYGGTGTSDGGSDLKGKRKPIVIGKIYDYSAPLVDAALHVYQVNDGSVADVPFAFDGGRALTKGADYADYAALTATAPSAGGYRVCPSLGFVRLAASPANEATFHVTEGTRDVSSAVQKVLTIMGMSSSDWIAQDFTDLSAASNDNVGWATEGDESAASIIDALCSGAGAFWYFDENAKFRIKQLTAPSGSSVATITNRDIINIVRVNQDIPGKGDPVYRVTVNHSKCWTPLTGVLDVAITDARRTFVQNEWRTETSTSSTVNSNYINPPEINIITSLQDATDAATEASRLKTMLETQRDTFEVVIADDSVESSSSNFITTITLGSVVTMTLNRFGCDSGRDFRVIGIQIDWTTRKLILTLWG